MAHAHQPAPGDNSREAHLEYAGRRYHHLWLRDNCPCAACRHPSGQRLHESWQLGSGITPVRVDVDARGLSILWADGHESRYTAEFLAAHAYDFGAPSTPLPVPVLWDAGLDPARLSFSYPQVAETDQIRLEWLRTVRDYGFAFLTDVPTTSDALFEVVGLFGFVRETNYGRLFEVVSQPDPVNLAYTPNPLSLHTDNPYRDPVPTLQVLHCLRAADEGGVTALADGLKAAEELRVRDPRAFELLATEAVDFVFQSDEADLRHRATMIGLDAEGRIDAIRVNNRSAAPFDVPFDRMPAFYQAYRHFMSVLHDGGSKITFRMQPGDLVLFDNRRVLHGRESQAMGERHLQGCYADRDNLLSVIRVLERGLNPG